MEKQNQNSFIPTLKKNDSIELKIYPSLNDLNIRKFKKNTNFVQKNVSEKKNPKILKIHGIVHIKISLNNGDEIIQINI